MYTLLQVLFKSITRILKSLPDGLIVIFVNSCDDKVHHEVVPLLKLLYKCYIRRSNTVTFGDHLLNSLFESLPEICISRKLLEELWLILDIAREASHRCEITRNRREVVQRGLLAVCCEIIVNIQGVKYLPHEDVIPVFIIPQKHLGTVDLFRLGRRFDQIIAHTLHRTVVLLINSQFCEVDRFG